MRRWLKAWYRRARDGRTRRQLRAAGVDAPPRLVLASTWDFPNPTHGFVYQDMLGLLEQGYDVRVLYGDRRSATQLAARFRPLLQRAHVVETLDSLHAADLRHLDALHPGAIDAFLCRVGEHTGQSLGALRQEAIVRRAATFTRLVEIAGARYLHSWFCYDQSFLAMFAAAVLGIPRGLSCFTDHVLHDHPFKLVPLQLATADLVLATSERTRGELLQLGGAAVAGKILVKPIGVEASRLRPLRARRAATSFELLSVCRLEPKKGLLTLVDACALLRQRGRQLVVRIIGGVDAGHAASIEYERQLRRRIDELQLATICHLEGALAHDAVAGVLASASAFVVPYVELATGDKDAMPTAMLEAMAAGLPIIGSRAGAIPEAVQDGREGLLVPPQDAVQLAAAIERLLDDEALRRRLGDAAAARFDREFDSRVTDVAMHRRMRELVDRGSGR